MFSRRDQLSPPQLRVVFAVCMWSAAALSSSEAAEASPLLLAIDGCTAYQIAISPDAGAAEQHAAEELSGFLGRVTGASFPVYPLSESYPERCLVVGRAAATAGLVERKELDGLGSEEFLIRTVGGRLALAGGTPRGTLYAVYAFLEDIVGCRWWTAQASHIPHQPTLRIPDTDRRERPAFQYRESIAGAMGADWAARNRLNGGWLGLDQRHGGCIGWPYFDDKVHTFYRLVPPDKYFAEHPEWFSEKRGRRYWQGGQLCLTNAELRRFVTQRVREILREIPEGCLADISQNDWGGRCECEACMSLECREGSPTGPLLDFVNSVAEAIEPESPQARISTLAYQYSRTPPRTIRPRQNVVILLCSYECSTGEPWSATGGEANAAFYGDLHQWAQIGANIYAWDYLSNFGSYRQPYPNLHVLGPNLRTYRRLGVQGLFACGVPNDLEPLRAWVLAKLLWDPDRDPVRLTDEFVAGYYGRAAGPVREYLRWMHDAVKRRMGHLPVKLHRRSNYLSLDVLSRAESLLVEAARLSEGSPDFARRVEELRLPLRCVWAREWGVLRREAAGRRMAWTGPDDYGQALADCRRSFERLGLAMDPFLADAIRLDDRPPALPARFRTLVPTDFADLQERDCWLGARRGVEGVSDPVASDGAAVRLDADYWGRPMRLVVACLLVAMVMGGCVGIWSIGRGSVPAILGTLAGLIVMAWGESLRLGPLGAALGVPETYAAGILAPAAALAGAAVVALVVRRWACRRTAATHRRPMGLRFLGGATAGGAVALLALAVLYNWGAVADSLRHDLEMERRRATAEGPVVAGPSDDNRTARNLLAGGKRWLERTSLAPWLDHLRLVPRDSAAPSWTVAYPTCHPTITLGTRFRCFVVTRTAEAETVSDLSWGIYDAEKRRSITQGNIRVTSGVAPAYSWYDLGVWDLNGASYVWFSQAVAGRGHDLLIDRLFVLREPDVAFRVDHRETLCSIPAS